MSRHDWHKSWNRSDDDGSERSSGCSHGHHRDFDRDGEPHERMRGGRDDIGDNGDRGGPPEHHFRSDYGDHGPDHADAPVNPLQHHDGGNLGWDAAAWNDAGGFESVLFGHLSNSLGAAGGMPPIIIFAIDDLNVEFNTLIQTTQIQNTLALLNASNGGSIDVGGDVTAIGLQSASTEHAASFMNFPDFS
jgi:hypothetical protein